MDKETTIIFKILYLNNPTQFYYALTVKHDSYLTHPKHFFKVLKMMGYISLAKQRVVPLTDTIKLDELIIYRDNIVKMFFISEEEASYEGKAY